MLRTDLLPQLCRSTPPLSSSYCNLPFQSSRSLTTITSGVVGFVRSYGKYLPEEGITLNAVCPNVVRTSISTDVFYDQLEKEGILTPMKGVVDAFASFLDSDVSGECMEVGPNGGFEPKAPAPHLDKETKTVMDRIYERSHRLHEPEQ